MSGYQPSVSAESIVLDAAVTLRGDRRSFADPGLTLVNILVMLAVYRTTE